MSTRKPTRLTVERLVTGEEMGYCCMYAFFRLHKRTGRIAATLGVSDRAIRYCKEKFRAGDYTCPQAATCLKGRLF